jgi:hypothetical protein
VEGLAEALELAEEEASPEADGELSANGRISLEQALSIVIAPAPAASRAARRERKIVIRNP